MHIKYIILVATITILGATNAMAIEEAAYDVIKKYGRFEIRDYASHILAETIVEGDFKEAGNKAFRRLFRYISGDNQTRDKITMTAPVSQKSKGEKIAMTAPVGQQSFGGKWVVSFMMPSSFTLETLPMPEDPTVSLRQVPTHRMASVRYTGLWSEKNYLRYKKDLETWIHEEKFTILGDPVWARYNAPFTLWFLRRNEILIPVDGNTE